MSIFVLNLATLLGLGLGVDYSLLMTSRFREELAAPARMRPDRVAAAVRATVATAGRAVFFSGLTVLLGLLGLVLFEFMILRSVGIAGAIVVGLAVALGADAAAGGPGDPRSRIDRLAIRRVAPRPARDGPWARLARRVMRQPLAVLVPTLPFLVSSGRRSCTSGSTPRTPRSCRRPCRRAPPSTGSRAEFGEGEFAPIVLAIRTRSGARIRPTWPRCTTTRGGSRRIRGSAGSTAWSMSIRRLASTSTGCSTATRRQRRPRLRAGRTTPPARRPRPRRDPPQRRSRAWP